MNNSLEKIFNRTENIVIGMIHLPPLLGYKDFPGLKVCIDKSLKNALCLVKGGVDGIIIENNYDIPHKEYVEPKTIDLIARISKDVVGSVPIPVGINVLWNDYKASLSITKTCGGRFVRIPVFVDNIKTECGIIRANHKDIIEYRKRIDALDIALFTDIQVKHAEMLDKKDITQSSREAIKGGSDGLIITGKWTGDAPDTSILKKVRDKIGSFPILIGSGTDKDNIKELLEYANGVIVGTSIKTGDIVSKDKETNLKPWQEEISVKKTKELISKIK